MRTLLASVMLLTLGAGVGLADETEKDCAAQRRGNPSAICQLSIGGEEIERELPRWTEEIIVGRGAAEHGTLIRLRLDFLDRIVHSADDL